MNQQIVEEQDNEEEDKISEKIDKNILELKYLKALKEDKF